MEAVLIGSGDESHIRELTAHGADVVHLADSSRLELYDTEAHTAILAAAIREHSPYAVLLPSTANGRDLAARVAGRLGLGLTGDCVGIEIDDEGRLSQLKPAFGGSIVAPILSRTLPNMATIRAGILSSCEPDYSIEPVVNRLETAGRHTLALACCPERIRRIRRGRGTGKSDTSGVGRNGNGRSRKHGTDPRIGRRARSVHRHDKGRRRRPDGFLASTR